MFKDETGEIVPAIVSEALWDRANDILNRRADNVKSRQGICSHVNMLTGKLHCTHCGAAYYRREATDKHGQKTSRWICSGKIKNGAHSCPSFPLYEEDLQSMILDVVQDTKVSTEALIAEYVERFEHLDTNNQIPQMIREQEQLRDLTQKKKSKLLEYNVTGAISDSDFIAMNKQCNQEIRDADANIKELERQRYNKDELRKQIESMESVMENMKLVTAAEAITPEFVDDFIDKIHVTIENKYTARLEIRIFTGESAKRSLKIRTGRRGKKEPQ